MSSSPLLYHRPALFHLIWIVPFMVMLWAMVHYTLAQYRHTYDQLLEAALTRIETMLTTQFDMLNQQAELLSQDNAIQTTLALSLRPQLEHYIRRNINYLNAHLNSAPVHLLLFDARGEEFVRYPALAPSSDQTCSRVLFQDAQNHLWMTRHHQVRYENRIVGQLCLVSDLTPLLEEKLREADIPPQQRHIDRIVLQGVRTPITHVLYGTDAHASPDPSETAEVRQRDIHLQNQTFRLELRARPFTDFLRDRLLEHTAFWGLIGSMLSIFLLYLSLQYWLNRRLKREKKRHAAIVSALDEGVIVLNHKGEVLHHNPAASSLIPENTDHPLWTLMKLEDTDSGKIIQLASVIRQVLQQDQCWQSDDFLRLTDTSGTSHYVSLTLRPMPESRNQVLMVIDFEDRLWQMLEEIRWQASHHPLTQLMTYRALKDRTQSWLHGKDSNQPESSLPPCFVLINFDHFKTANDALGHTIGDVIIRRMAERLEDLCARQAPDPYHLAQLEGAEFIILFRASDKEEQERFLQTLLPACRLDFAYQNQIYHFTASIATTPIMPYDQDLDDVLNRATVAIQFIKQQGGNGLISTDSLADYTTRHQHTVSLIPWLQQALHEDRFELVGQRILDLNHPDALPRFEVLLRLKDSEGKPISPALFIPAAERFGLVRDIDRWVIRNVIASIAELYHYATASQLQGYRFSINLSSISLGDAQLFEYIQEQCDLHKVPLEALGFEVTETALISNLENARNLLVQLHEQGATLLLDDFGTGMSSLGYLKHLPLDIIKIDGSFIRNMLDSPTDRAIVTTIVTLAHQLGHHTVAEFVENEALMTALKAMGVDYGQGYGIEPPKPLAQCIQEIATCQVLPSPAMKAAS